MLSSWKSHYSNVEKVGQGAFGEVMKGQPKTGPRQGTWVALKTVNLKAVPDEFVRKRLKNEAELLMKFDHWNLLRLYNYLLDDTTGMLYLEMEYCQDGDLAKAIVDQKGQPFNENQIRNWFAQMTLAVEYLQEKHHLVHRDINPLNIYLCEKKTCVKLGDFGISKLLNYLCLCTTPGVTHGTLQYMSPQLLGGEDASFKDDIWSLGVVLFELATLRRPFVGGARPTALSIYREIEKGKWSCEVKMGDTLRKLLQELLHPDASKRPAVSQLLACNFLKPIFLQAVTVGVSTIIRPDSPKWNGDGIARQKELEAEIEQLKTKSEAKQRELENNVANLQHEITRLTKTFTSQQELDVRQKESQERNMYLGEQMSKLDKVQLLAVHSTRRDEDVGMTTTLQREIEKLEKESEAKQKEVDERNASLEKKMEELEKIRLSVTGLPPIPEEEAKKVEAEEECKAVAARPLQSAPPNGNEIAKQDELEEEIKQLERERDEKRQKLQENNVILAGKIEQLETVYSHIAKPQLFAPQVETVGRQKGLEEEIGKLKKESDANQKGLERKNAHMEAEILLLKTESEAKQKELEEKNVHLEEEIALLKKESEEKQKDLEEKNVHLEEQIELLKQESEAKQIEMDQNQAYLEEEIQQLKTDSESRQKELEDKNVTLEAAIELLKEKSDVRERYLEDKIVLLQHVAVNKSAPSNPEKEVELYEACYRGDTNYARHLLMKQQVDPNAKYHKAKHGEVAANRYWINGRTALMFAAWDERVDTVKMMIREISPNVDQQNVDGMTALHCAAYKGCLPIVQLLCDDGKAHFDKKDKYGETPLMIAARYGRFDVVEYLLRQGANVNERNVFGRRALSFAKGDNVKRIMQSHGAIE